jgi:hypothetical protein
MTKEEQDEIWEEFHSEILWCIDGDGCFDTPRFMSNKEDYIIIRKPKQDEQETKKES